VTDWPWRRGEARDGRVFHTVDRIAGSDGVLEDALHSVDRKHKPQK
jgi:hypothetical protein